MEIIAVGAENDVKEIDVSFGIGFNWLEMESKDDCITEHLVSKKR
jgi:hypothetical protein